MINELCVVGHPGKIGGADTELDHQIRCWMKMGVKVHLCPTTRIDQNAKRMDMTKRGCVYHGFGDWESLKGFHVISFCNGGFLTNLDKIKRYAKTTTFVNCMTWNFPKELECQSKGLIDFHLYQSDHGMKMVGAKLSKYKDYRPLRFQPYFYSKDFPFHKNRPTDKFRFGRISRGDAQKFAAKQLWIYDQIDSSVKKEGIVLGWDKRAEHKLLGGTQIRKTKPMGTIRSRRLQRIKRNSPKTIRNKRFIPKYLTTYPECKISQQEFYKFSDCIIMATDTFENLPRVGFEAMSSGSILVVDNRGGWKVLVDDKKTGFLCNTPEEFVSIANELSKDSDRRDEIRHNARQRLECNWGLETSMKSWELVFNEWNKLK